MLTEAAPAKLNLFLHILGRRADGYHLLDSLAVFAAAADRLHATPADTLTLSVTGPHGAALADAADNLVLRAARALAQAAGITAGAALTLEKHLPVASGIGGGSADAAAALRLLARLWNLQPAPADLAVIAARLGADVPVCLATTPCRMGGVGEILTAPPMLPRFGLALVNPGLPVATAAVFRARQGGFSDPLTLPARFLDAAALAEFLASHTRNDLESPARALCPAIDEALAALAGTPGCLLARMSGSGATCFGLFASPEAAIAPTNPGWWSWAGACHGA